MSALTACGDERSAADRRVTVTISDSRFSEDELHVSPGTVVVWENTDPYDHTVTSRSGSAVDFDSGDLSEGDLFEFEFDEPGVASYLCRIHPTMRASIVVE
ncbi:MAG: cupredoxin domain-containing protein [Ilumatobacteraceae bacterium]